MTSFSSAERLLAVDFARGIALLGVALVNVHAFASVWSSVDDPLPEDAATATPTQRRTGMPAPDMSDA